MNIKLLREEMEKEGYTIETLANKIRVDAEILRQHFENPTAFTVKEVIQIVKTLHTDGDTATLIFFDVIPQEERWWYDEPRRIM